MRPFNIRKILLLLIAIALFAPNFFTEKINPELPYNGKEKFNPSLSRLSSIVLLEKYTDSIAQRRQIPIGSYAYAELLGAVVEERFYHGFSHFSPSQNWVAAFAGRLIKEDYACIVEPDKIMQHPNAACSQQAMVMMHVLRNKGMACRSLGFPHHYAIEVFADNEWYFFDANMEPPLTKGQRALTCWQHNNDMLKQHYDKKQHHHLDFQFGNGLKAYIGGVNEKPAQRAAMFHAATAAMSKILFLFPLLLIFFRPVPKLKLPFIPFAGKKRKPSFSLSA